MLMLRAWVRYTAVYILFYSLTKEHRALDKLRACFCFYLFFRMKSLPFLSFPFLVVSFWFSSRCVSCRAELFELFELFAVPPFQTVAGNRGWLRGRERGKQRRDGVC